MFEGSHFILYIYNIELRKGNIKIETLMT